MSCCLFSMLGSQKTSTLGIMMCRLADAWFPSSHFLFPPLSKSSHKCLITASDPRRQTNSICYSMYIQHQHISRELVGVCQSWYALLRNSLFSYIVSSCCCILSCVAHNLPSYAPIIHENLKIRMPILCVTPQNCQPCVVVTKNGKYHTQKDDRDILLSFFLTFFNFFAWIDERETNPLGCPDTRGFLVV